MRLVVIAVVCCCCSTLPFVDVRKCLLLLTFDVVLTCCRSLFAFAVDGGLLIDVGCRCLLLVVALALAVVCYSC